MVMNYPKFPKTDFTEDYFGIPLADPYRGLQNAKDPKVLQWVKEENQFTDNWFDQKELAEKIEELKSQKRKPLYQSICSWGDGFAAAKQVDGNFQLVRLNASMEQEQLLVQRGTIENFTPFQLLVCPSDQNKVMVYGLYDGEARPSALVVDWESKTVLATLKNTFGVVWSKNKAIAYYADTVSDTKAQTCRSRVMACNAVTGEEACVFEDTQNSIIGSVHVAADKQHLMLEMWDDYCHSRFYAMEEATGRVEEVTQSIGVQLTYLDSLDGFHFFISKEGSSFGKVIQIPYGKTLAEAETLREETTQVLDGGFVLNGKLYLTMMDNVSTKIVCLEKDGEREVPLPQKIGTAFLCGKGEGKVFFTYESFAYMPVLLSFDGGEMAVVQRSSQEEYPDVVVEQRFAPSVEDKEPIPYFIVHRKDAKADGKTPTWIYAYGGYNSAMHPWATDKVGGLNIARWVQQGGIYVLATLRGGSEYGTRWHEQGMLMNKKNCYSDFIGVAQQLIADGWTNREKLVICGCSNGGLLMSALVTMRPDLFRCVLDSVPHTDMIHFAEDDRGPMYITEYGNPKESKEMFQYLLSYSPYHNVRQEQYPWVYIQTGECDNNVPPYHGKKFAARMQELNQSPNPILLRVLEKGSHDRGSGEVYWQTIAEMQLFVKKALGL